MTDEQFKQLMDKLEELKRAPHWQHATPVQYPKPLSERTYWDGLPPSWTEGAKD